MRRTLPAALLLMTTLVAPTAVMAAEAHPSTTTATVRVRVYDPYRRDRHYWDTREERAYRAYLAERHHRYVTYRHQTLAERRAYWRWRHEREERLEHERR